MMGICKWHGWLLLRAVLWMGGDDFPTNSNKIREAGRAARPLVFGVCALRARGPSAAGPRDFGARRRGERLAP